MDRPPIAFATAEGVATITIDRADKVNALDAAMIARLIALFETVAADAATRVVVLRGAGRHFSAGGDMGDIAAMLDPDAERRAATMRDTMLALSRPLALTLAAVPQPVVASVRGHAIGVGLQLVLMADLTVASTTARFTLPQLDLGHTPDHGESWALPRKVGLSRALQMTLVPDRVDAATAERYGLVNWVVEDGELEARTDAVARRIAAGPPLATRTAKALFHASEGSTLAETIAREADALATVGRQADFVEAITAFGERRRPLFQGR